MSEQEVFCQQLQLMKPFSVPEGDVKEQQPTLFKNEFDMKTGSTDNKYVKRERVIESA